MRIKSFKVRSVIALNKREYSNKQIGKILDLTNKQLHAILHARRIKSNIHDKIEDVKTLSSFIVGTTLGDSYLSKIEGSAKTSRLSVAHNPKQKDYLIWKKLYLESYGFRVTLSHNIHYNNRYKSGSIEEYRINTQVHPIFTKYRNILYVNNEKIVPENLELTPLSIALLFMDDGSKATCGYNIHVCNFNDTSVQNLVDIFDNTYNLRCTIHANNSIYVSAKSVKDFNNIISSYMIDCMRYKLHYHKAGSV